MNLFKRKLKLVTHDGQFHADDVFACAAVSIWADIKNLKLKIIRTREPEIIKEADIVVDVGMEYNPDKNRFDHHQKGGAGIRGNNIPYASFGLVWKKYGEIVCSDKEIADEVEEKLVMPIDVRDNGVNISLANEFGIYDHRTSDVLSNLNPTFEEGEAGHFQRFERALYLAKEILDREILWSKVLIGGRKQTLDIIKMQNDPEILILDKYLYWEEAVSRFKNIKFVVYRHRNGKDWCLQVGRDDLKDYYSSRATLPLEWAGLRDGELSNISGIKDAVFCANGGWFAVTKTKEAALEMARKALAT